MFRAAAIALLLVSTSALSETRTSGEILAASEASAWRRPAQENLLYVTLPGGTAIFELTPTFAPAHVANIRALVAAGFHAGSAVVRSQENYVVQWSNTADPAPSRGDAKPAIPLETVRTLEGLAVTPLASRDPYAPHVGILDGFPIAHDGERAWLTHCYGMLGVARGAPETGSGDSLYVVIGHAPRHLDRNGTLVGRALAGMEHLSTLRRGTGALGFYETPEEAVPLTSVHLGSDLGEDEQVTLEVLRTDTGLFGEFVGARTTRTEDWFVDPTGAIGLCNVPIPVRVVDPTD